MKFIEKKICTWQFAYLALLLTACENEFNRIGTDIVSGGHFETNKAYAEVFAYNRKITQVQTSGLPIYQLGSYTDPVYGETQASIAAQLLLQGGDPVFGTYDAETESQAATDTNNLTIPENETVTQVYLDIPFFSTVTETDDDGNRTFQLDSIYGNLQATFQMQVAELTYYLRNLDPATQFQDPQNYFSDQDFSAYTGSILFNGMYSINPEEIVIYEEDDPTTETNEAEEVKERLTPRIRLFLDPAFFQQRILDAEGSELLANNNNFREYIRGLYLSATAFSDDVLMLLDLSDATIQIEYQYDKVDTKATDSTGDDEIVPTESAFQLSLSGIAVNTFANSPYPGAIANQLDTGDNASRLYLKGGQGTLIELQLFDGDGTDTNLSQIRANNWLINEANLVFYVDREALDNAGSVIEPDRIYLYDLDTNVPVLDYFLDQTANLINPRLSRTVFGGMLERDEDDKGIRYKIRITDHINNILRKDAENVRLGLVIISSDANVNPAAATLAPATEASTVLTSVINPLGTVLYGSHPDVAEEVRLRLEIFYTDPNG